jgi:hypothetical protein
LAKAGINRAAKIRGVCIHHAIQAVAHLSPHPTRLKGAECGSAAKAPQEMEYGLLPLPHEHGAPAAFALDRAQRLPAQELKMCTAGRKRERSAREESPA